MIDLTPYADCIYQVHPTTIEHIIKNESNFRPLAINVNRLKGRLAPKVTQPTTVNDAIELANYYVSLGHSVDLGLMQINSNNLNAYNVTIEEMFEPCKNIEVGSRLLHESYQRALSINPNPSAALQIALSYYNTGSPYKGFNNGYVDKYFKSISTVSKDVLTATSTVSTQDLYQKN